MKQLIQRLSVAVIFAALFAPVSSFAQNEDKHKEEKGQKDKKEGEQIIITRKDGKENKIVVEVIGEKILVNGKEVKDGDDGDVSVRRQKIKDVWAYGAGNSFGRLSQTWNNNEDGARMFDMDENRAMLGVTTESADEGVEIQTVTKESAAEKAGLKKGDIIKKVDETKIESPDDLSETIQDHKPGDKVTVTYIRDKKEQKVTTELGKWKGAMAFKMDNGDHKFNYNYDLGDLKTQLRTMPRAFTAPNGNWSWSGSNGPRLGISVQDTEDGKGVSVLEVDEDGNAAKAGIKENDVITEVDGKAVNGADEIAKVIRDNKEKSSVKVKLLRDGKSETIDVKIPKKLKTTDL